MLARRGERKPICREPMTVRGSWTRSSHWKTDAVESFHFFLILALAVAVTPPFVRVLSVFHSVFNVNRRVARPRNLLILIRQDT